MTLLIADAASVCRRLGEGGPKGCQDAGTGRTGPGRERWELAFYRAREKAQALLWVSAFLAEASVGAIVAMLVGEGVA